MLMRARLDAALLTRPPRLLHALLPGCEWRGPAATAGGPSVVYLTFDDGPVPDETPWVLEQLALFGAKATFFCVGENLARYPEIARAALAAGHRLGNHTQHHRSGWATPRPAYLADVAACDQALADLLPPLPSALADTADVALGTDSAAIEAGTVASAAAEVAAIAAHDASIPSEAVAGPIATAPSPFAALSPPQPLFRPPYGRLTRAQLRALRADYRIIMWSVLTRDYDADLRPEDCLRFALEAVRAGDVVVFHDSRKAGPRLRYVLPRLLAHLAAQGFTFATL